MTTPYEQHEEAAKMQRANRALELQKEFEKEVFPVGPEDVLACCDIPIFSEDERGC